MPKETQEVQESTVITIGDTTFKTGGNIVFGDTTESPYVIASNPMLSKMEAYLEHGIDVLMKRIKP